MKKPIYAIYHTAEGWQFQLFDDRFPDSALSTHREEIKKKIENMLGPTAYPMQDNLEIVKKRVAELNEK